VARCGGRGGVVEQHGGDDGVRRRGVACVFVFVCVVLCVQLIVGRSPLFTKSLDPRLSAKLPSGAPAPDLNSKKRNCNLRREPSD
jgi:hypothetical protein